MSIVFISGSPSLQSRSTRLLSYVGHLLKEAGQNVSTIQVRQLDATALVQADWNHPDIKRAIKTVAQARVVIVATPVYKAAYSGILKAFLDLLPQDAFEGKTVGAIATGGSVAHTLAIDYAIKPVLSALGARHQLQGVFGADKQIEIRENSDFRLDTPLQERLNDLAFEVLNILSPGSALGPSSTTEFESYIKVPLEQLSAELAQSWV